MTMSKEVIIGREAFEKISAVEGIGITKSDKRKEYDKKYYEKKKEKKQSTPTEGSFIDFKMLPEAKDLAVNIMNGHKSNPDFIHSFIEYIEVLYHDFYQSEMKRLGIKTRNYLN